MALVSSGALHSCEDHLQKPRSVSAACLESLAFIQAQNGNASNSSVLSAASSFIFSLLSLSSDFSHPSATGGGSLSAQLLCPFSLFFQPLLSAGNLPLLPSAFLHCFLLLPPPTHTHTPSLRCALRSAKSLKGIYCS